MRCAQVYAAWGLHALLVLPQRHQTTKRVDGSVNKISEYSNILLTANTLHQFPESWVDQQSFI